ncbi:alanine or glycine:cation symporter, AGCS family [Lentibacillus persicus]|uniref:Alanine or glycine:cation symporter, AGCS family n=1 Tax=Lentibacillus persicus TaxID=640948 RepID=A0A1I1WBI9_9BACI|nr:amino acid carrier protein [Lentibacillus persicus]SFD90420.1 alanine or glycine:cation symporter, AGCS family [Lentibacillus persicus]
MLNHMMTWVENVNGILWGPAALIFLAAIGIYLTIGTKFVHIKKFRYILKQTITNNKKDEDGAEGVITSSQSLFTSLASVIGMGSIVGVASALISGGPGALIWMWIASFIGMIIKYSEIILIIKYRKKTELGEFVGGPALYVKNGLKVPALGEIIVLLMVLVCLCSTMIQSNVIIENTLNFTGDDGVSKYAFAVINVVLVGIVLVGGIKRVGAVAEKIVPFMSGFYFIAGIIVIIANYANIIPSIQVMLQGFVSPVAVGGGVVGYGIKEAMQYGIARGFFVSGAGQSVFTVSHAPAKVKNPVEQAMYAITEIFLVTIICTVTGLSILTSGILSPEGNAAILVNEAFAQTSPFLGVFAGIALILFAYSTVIGLGYVGESQLSTIIHAGKAKIYRYVFLLFTFLGGIGGLQSIWAVTDLFLALVMFLNLIVMLLMSKEIFKTSNDFWLANDNEKRKQT